MEKRLLVERDDDDGMENTRQDDEGEDVNDSNNSSESDTIIDDLKEHDEQEVQSPIYYASLLGLTDVVQWLEEQGIDPSTEGGYFGFPLQAAIAMNRDQTTRYFLHLGIGVAQAGGMYGSALNAAAAVSSPDIVELLLSAGADPKVADKNGVTALHHAVERGNTGIIELLLKTGADVDALDKRSFNPATVASALGKEEILSLLISHGAKVDSTGPGSPMLRALVADNAKVLDFLLKNGCNVNTIFSAYGNQSALQLASFWQHVNVTRLLLERGANPNQSTGDEWTPLQNAAVGGNIDIIEALISKGANVAGDPTSKVLPPLLLASSQSHYSAVKVLLKHGADVNEVGTSGATSLMIAAKKKDKDMIQLLLDRGARLSCLLENQQASVIDIGIALQDPSVIELLVRKGCFRCPKADSSAESEYLVMSAFAGDMGPDEKMMKSDSCVTFSSFIMEEAIRAAAARGHKATIVLLLQDRRVQINAQDITGRTPLHHASKHCHWELADFLLERGASIYVEDLVGATPMDLAIAHGLKAVGFIENHMDNFTVGISRRPSLSAVTTNSTRNLSVLGTRKTITGTWSGTYENLVFNEGLGPFSLTVPSQPSSNMRPNTFSNEGEDNPGKFRFHGFVDSIGTIWFVKLYRAHGWLYRGQLDAEKSVFKGTGGRNRKLMLGTFKLVRQLEQDTSSE